FWVDGRQVRSNFGTTKYCATYLRNSPCQNPDCLYLHELGDEEDRFTKEEIQQRSLLAPPIPPGAVTVTGGGGPSGTGKRCTSPFLPPPVYESSDSGPGGAPQRMMGQPAAAAQRAGGRGAKPSAQLRNSALLQQMQQQRRPHEAQAVSMTSKTSGSVGVAWGGAGAANGSSAQPSGVRIPSAAEVLRRNTSAGASAASPTASPHLQAHDPTRLQEEWPSLADTAAPAPAPAPTPQTTNRRNRRKKEKQTAQLFPPQITEEVASPPVVPVSPPQDPEPVQESTPPAPQTPTVVTAASAAEASAGPTTPAPAPIQTAQPPAASPPTAVASTTVKRPPPRNPASASQFVGSDLNTPLCAMGISSLEKTGRRPQGAAAEALSRTSSVQETESTSVSPRESSSSMFSNPFFSTNGATSATTSSSPAPPGFGDLPPASVVTTAVPAGTTSPAVPAAAPTANAAPATLSSPRVDAGNQPGQSLLGEHFGGTDLFNGGMFSSSAIAGGLFAGDPGVGATCQAGKMDPVSTVDLGTSPAAGDVTQGLRAERSSPSQGDRGASPLVPATDVNVSFDGLLKPTIPVPGKQPTEGTSMPMSSGSMRTRDCGIAASSAAPPTSASSSSPFGAAFGGGHYGGAFGSALFPVSSHQGGGGMRSNGVLEETGGPGADLSVDPFANSSGALAAMLGVTLPPVDSQSSLASKMRSGGGESRLASSHDMSTHRTISPSRKRYEDFATDDGRNREGGGHGRGGHRQDFGGTDGSSGGA
ncbi:unnamed protein product, partial [Sphacelaria rigidula]